MDTNNKNSFESFDLYSTKLKQIQRFALNIYY